MATSRAILRSGGLLTNKILVMEDESAVLAMTETMLRMFGYDVLTAEDGVEGLEVYQDNRDAISLVLVDLLMPRMSGAEVIAALREYPGETKILLTSGYPDSETAAVEALADACLHKPFRMEQLKDAVGALVGTPDTPGH